MAINLNLELTDHCNIKCKMCSQSMRKEAHGVPMRFMSWDTWRSSLQNLQQFPDEIHLCPHWLGEPTIHPQFEQFIEYAFASNNQNRLFRKFKLHTNGVVFAENRARLLVNLANLKNQHRDTFNFLHFSIDAHTPETYKIVKGVDYGKRVYQNILRFLELRQELKSQYPKITLAFVVQTENAQEALSFRDHWVEQFSHFDLPLRQTYDWPDKEQDTLYFRRLNCAEQDKSDALHASVIHKLGLIDPNLKELRLLESF
jgi:MoaA/NifB/PqqE/SkfB family radical SAM enzyme